MEIPDILLSSAELSVVIERVKAKRLAAQLSWNTAFLVDAHQPYFFIDQSGGGPDELAIILPQIETTRTAGAEREKYDVQWITQMVGAVLGNWRHLNELSDVKFSPINNERVRALFNNGMPDINVRYDHSLHFKFNEQTPLQYCLNASWDDPDESIEIILARVDASYVVFGSYAGPF